MALWGVRGCGVRGSMGLWGYGYDLWGCGVMGSMGLKGYGVYGAVGLWDMVYGAMGLWGVWGCGVMGCKGL